MSNRFLSVGECMVELAEVDADLFRRGFAGDTFNAAWYARAVLGAEWVVGFLSCIGTDAISEEMAAFIASQGIDTTDLRRVEGATVGLYMISLEDGERSFSYWRETSAARRLADDGAAIERAFAGASHVHVSGITAAILSPDARVALKDALGRARERGTTVSLDTNMRPRLWESREVMCRELKGLAAVADIVLPSFDEEAEAFGDKTPKETIERYRAWGSTTVVVKNGGAPVEAWSHSEGEVSVPIEPVDVVDTTAAGDSFAGSFLAALLEGEALREAISGAASVSARVIQAHGALIEMDK